MEFQQQCPPPPKFSNAKKALPGATEFIYSDIGQDIIQGKLGNLNKFLNNNIRNFGSLMSSSDLVKGATGEDKISPEIFLKYLEQKYLS